MLAGCGRKSENSFAFYCNFFAVKLGIFRHGRNENFRLCFCFLMLNEAEIKFFIFTVIAVAFNLTRDSYGVRTCKNLLVNLRIREAVKIAPIGVAPLVRIEQIKQKFNMRKPFVTLGKAAPFADYNGNSEPLL